MGSQSRALELIIARLKPHSSMIQLVKVIRPLLPIALGSFSTIIILLIILYEWS